MSSLLLFNDKSRALQADIAAAVAGSVRQRRQQHCRACYQTERLEQPLPCRLCC